jgi:outer membrane lipoprotein-sorting protein
MNKSKLTLILVAALLLLVGVTAVMAADNPVVYDNWQSGDAAFECAAIGDYDYGYKVDAAAPNGSWTHEGNTITILNSNGNVFDWEATSSIGAVIVKAGTGANVWFYDPQAMSDTGLYGYQNREISHVTFCWDAVMDYEELTVEKTAVTSYTRTHDWSIDKNVDPTELYLYIDGSGDSTATWTVDVFYEGYTDSDFNVSGIITIKNTGTLAADYQC